MFSSVTDYVLELTEKKKLPLLDVSIMQDHKQLYRFYTGYNYAPTGKEDLCVFSCTKPITVCAAMQLVERGLISLDDELLRYIPAFGDAYLLDADGKRRPPARPITVRHLFTMSAGFNYNRSTEPIKQLSKTGWDTVSTAGAMSAVLASPLCFDPGERFMYSLCHDALGALIEAVSGLTLDQYFKENVFNPLSMNNSSVDKARFFETRPKTYRVEDGGIVDAGDSTYLGFHITDKFQSGGAGLISRVEDYARFADAMACGGEGAGGARILSEDSVRALSTVQIDKLNVQTSFTCVQGKDYGYGLGVRVRTVDDAAGIPIGEFGWDGAAGTYMLADTENRISVVIGMNILNWPAVFTGEHLELCRRAYRALGLSRR